MSDQNPVSLPEFSTPPQTESPNSLKAKDVLEREKLEAEIRKIKAETNVGWGAVVTKYLIPLCPIFVAGATVWALYSSRWFDGQKAELSAQKATLTFDTDRLKEQKAELNATIFRKEQEKEKIQLELTDATNQLEQLRLETNKLSTAIAYLESQLKVLTNSAATQGEKLEALTRENLRLVSLNSDLNRQNFKMTAALQKIQRSWRGHEVDLGSFSVLSDGFVHRWITANPEESRSKPYSDYKYYKAEFYRLANALSSASKQTNLNEMLEILLHSDMEPSRGR